MLIVDDNPQVRRLVRGITNDLSDEFFECEDGDEVLAAFGRHVPDWIVMDVEMARMDGIEATKILMAAHPTAKVIIMTKHNDTITRLAAVAAGAYAFCGKDDLLLLRTLIADDGKSANC